MSGLKIITAEQQQRNQPMDKPTLHLIEPTLFDQAGHCFSYTSSIISANAENLDAEFAMHVWLAHNGKGLLDNFPCVAHLYFYRSIRRLQKILLYYKLLQQKTIIYICTAELVDLIIINWLLKVCTGQATVFFHFHQFKQTAKKLQALKKIATEQPSLHIITPTAKLTNIFQAAGFQNCLTVPCPSFPRPAELNQSVKKFSKVIYAGAARKDKGFPEIVTLVSHTKKIGIHMPFALQISPPNSGRYDYDSQMAINKLMALPKNDLTLHKKTLDKAQYQALFANAICLLIYDPTQYADKFSGVALDACYAACPIITVANTWMGDLVTRFKAGIALDNRRPEHILRAINVIKQNYAMYSENAALAATALADEHAPQNTIRAIQQNLAKQGRQEEIQQDALTAMDLR